MAERRASATDGLGWLLLICGLVAALCVLSHEPAASAPNLLGAPGHWLAEELYAALGSAVYVLLVAWFVLVLMLLVGKGWLRWTRRFAGWLVLLPVTAVAADWLGSDWLPGPIFGSGGALDAAACASCCAMKCRGCPGFSASSPSRLSASFSRWTTPSPAASMASTGSASRLRLRVRDDRAPGERPWGTCSDRATRAHGREAAKRRSRRRSMFPSSTPDSR